MSLFTAGLLACLVVAVVEGAAPRNNPPSTPKPSTPADNYPTKFDNIDLQHILHNQRLLDSYFKCIMEGKPCTPDGEELRKHIPEALKTECAKCSEKQKKGTEIVIRFLLENKPEMFKEFEKKFDPNGTYRKKYEKTAAKHGIKL